MTDRFKKTLIKMFPEQPIRLDTVEEISDFLRPHWLTIKEALTLATEAEQLRKQLEEAQQERDELAEYIYKVGNGKNPVIAKYYELAKKVNKNGNA